MRKSLLTWTGITVGAFLVGAFGAFGYDAISSHANSLAASVADSVQTAQDAVNDVFQNKVTLTFVGDIMLDRGVRRSVEKNFNNDYNALFKNTNLFQTDDITFGNFEGTATTEGYKTGSIYSFRMDPSAVTAVKNAGIDIVSFANNHAGDYALSGFTGTMDEFTKNQLPFVGAGSNYADATTPRIIEKNGIRIGYLGFSDVGPNWITAKETSPGILLASDPDFAGIIARAKGECDVLVVSVHWGVEYKPHTLRQEELAHSAVDAGADIVVGTHPHIPQDLETYKNKLIIYSLGNLVFDQYFSNETMSGLVIQTTVTKDGVIGNTKEFVSTQNKQYQLQSVVEKADFSKKEITLGWVGDIPPSNILPSVPKNIRELLSSPDLMTGNLEGALGAGEDYKCGTATKECYSFIGTNDFALTLHSIGFDAVNIANNHAYDAGKIGLLDTKNILSVNNLLAVGEYGKLTTTTVNGVDVALLGFGTNYWTESLSNLERVRSQIASASKTYPIVVVFFHGGAEGEGATHITKNTELYKGEDRGNPYLFAHTAIDAGADLVLGSGPHVVRAIEKYNDRLIVYSAGNFLTTDGMASRGALGASGLFTITVDGNGKLKNTIITSLTAETKDAITLDETNTALNSIISLTAQDIGQAISADAGGTIYWQ